MSNKNKNAQPFADSLQNIGRNLGIVLMTGAATLGMLELPDHSNRVALTPQPAFVINENNELNNPLRREREEETADYTLTYNVSQRSPSTAGKQ